MVTRMDNLVELPDIKIPGIAVHRQEQEWDMILENYLNDLKKARPNAYGPSPISDTDINTFFELVRQALISRQNSEGIKSSKRILFLEEESPEEIDTESITFELTRRDNGSFSQGPFGEGRIKEVTPHYRTEIQDPDRPGERLITMSKRYDNWITFYIYARSNKQARKRLLWFEKLMEGFRWYFKLYGFSALVYQGCGARESFNLGELRLTRYPITYGLMTEDTYHVSRQELRKLVINANVSNN